MTTYIGTHIFADRGSLTTYYRGLGYDPDQVQQALDEGLVEVNPYKPDEYAGSAVTGAYINDEGRWCVKITT